MTKEEFLPTLSPKAQNIVQENLKLFHNNKTFQVFHSNESKVLIQSNSDYMIYIKNNSSEDTFLHEFFHCVQHETGFPSLIYTVQQYEDLSTSVNSLILDLDIMERLENYGYTKHLKSIKKAVKMSTKLLRFIQQFNDKEELTNLYDIIGLAGFMLNSDIKNIKNSELSVLIKNTRPEALKYYSVFSECIKLYPYNTPDGVNNIFHYLLENLEFSSFMKIQTHCTN